jgi:hypothetical protein
MIAEAILDEASHVPPHPSWLASATSGRTLIAKRILHITTAQYPTLASRPLIQFSAVTDSGYGLVFT